jgi:competence protein ComEA
MKKIVHFIRTSLSLSAAEARGVLFGFGAFILILGLIFGVDFLLSQKTQKLLISSPQMVDSLTVRLDKQASFYQSDTYKDYQNSPQNHSSNPIRLFTFDPNTASVEDFQHLGLPKFLAERIEKYRNKGGKFKKKEDLAKIYGLQPETFERLEPYIALPSAENESLETPQAKLTERPSVSPETQPTIEKKSKPETLAKFDLNTADTTQLKLIRGIGSGYAKRIIKFREALGGFANAELVRETFQLPPEVADELLKLAYVKGGYKKLKINDLAEIKHPFLRYNQTKAIVAYRTQHGNFKSIDDLRQIKILDEETIRKIEPYLEF